MKPCKGQEAQKVRLGGILPVEGGGVWRRVALKGPQLLEQDFGGRLYALYYNA